MKKFLLSLAMVLGICAAASAESVTLPGADKVWENYTWTEDGDNIKGTVEGYSLLLEMNSSTTALVKPDQYSIRVYAGAQLHITAPEGETFSKVEITINSNGNKATSATASAGWTVSAFDNGKFTMTAATPQSTLTFDGAGKQLRVGSMVITTGESGEDPDPTPDPDPVGDGVVVDFSTDANADLLPS
ncbi:MAG: hypothetical protein K2F72_00120, partial [Muribaculaceae bacterium]|nr:hypothetical protein [Muribaculaceae bacterium]